MSDAASGTWEVVEGDAEFYGNPLNVEGPSSGLEKIYDYEAGGHHPVHLGEILNQQYKVIHKLGSGGHANVWLCRNTTNDTPRYVALKIIMAEASIEDCPELRYNELIDAGLDKDQVIEHLDQFEIGGPNGLHYVFVYPVLGPRVSRIFSIIEEDSGAILRQMCFQVTKAVSALHSRGICHGDLRPSNILACITGIDGLSEEDVVKALGKPETARIVTASGKPHDLDTAPQYLVYPIVWDDVALGNKTDSFITGKASIIDFGEAFEISKPPPVLGAPQTYCSPEYTLEGRLGVCSDTWMHPF
ncbi:kinase-like domain-containing protein [Hypoxylon sp. NC1633]|nr:kinase-like domain-containing protein [Hypoxylon sp. NC1633]